MNKANNFLYPLYKRLGLTFYRAGNYKQAVSFFKKTSRLKNNDAESYRLLALSFIQMGKHQDAARCYEKIFKINPKETNSLGSLGDIYFQLGNYKKATHYYRKLIELNPQNYLAYGTLADTCLAIKNYQDAVRYYEKAITLKPDMPALNLVYYNIASCWAKLKDKEKTFANLQKAVKSGFNDFWKIQGDPDFDFVRNEDEYKKLLTSFNKLKA